jgi:1-acyl-sn-glycerol-3-phosphate acyltransferase
MKGPLLIAANHPNSFLDAIILSSLFKSPIHSLARGDAFAGKWTTKFLKTINMLPVYRVSEGVENLEHNYTTFDACQKLFEENKIVLIFSEGRCINEWHLRRLKKGTARLALAGWQLNVPLKVLPLGINYSSFRKFGKTIHLNFGAVIQEKDMYEDLASGKGIVEFNEKLNNQLKELVYEIPKDDEAKLKSYFFNNPPLLKKIVLFLPAVAGFILNAPLYLVIHLIIRKISKDHYDSVMISLLILFYPLYVTGISLLLFYITDNYFAWFLLLLMPFTAWSYLQLKKQY